MDEFLAGICLACIVIGCAIGIMLFTSFIHDASIDRGECLERRKVQTTQIVMVGKIPITQPVTVNKCVQWEFPEGRPE